MDNFKFYSQDEINGCFTPRAGEQKLGETIHVLSALEDLNTTEAKFILLGIPEDIGVMANFGIAGTSSSWEPVLRAILSAQSNDLLSGSQMAILGRFVVEEPGNASLSGLRSRVEEIDAMVFPVIQKIVEAGKTPVVIGGGHNNAFPIIKGVSLGLDQPIAIVNIDAHADIRNTSEGRHSGNGFSNALEQGFLEEYFVFGLHESYNNQYTRNLIATNPKINAFFFDDLLKHPQPVNDAWLAFTATLSSTCGLEIDLDSIEGILSSAGTPSGFALNDVRSIVLNKTKKFTYLHICEGAVKLADGRENSTTAKAIGYLVTDFVKTQG